MTWKVLALGGVVCACLGGAALAGAVTIDWEMGDLIMAGLGHSGTGVFDRLTVAGRSGTLALDYDSPTTITVADFLYETGDTGPGSNGVSTAHVANHAFTVDAVTEQLAQDFTRGDFRLWWWAFLYIDFDASATVTFAGPTYLLDVTLTGEDALYTLRGNNATGTLDATFTVRAIPEPPLALLLGVAAFFVAFLCRRDAAPVT